MKTFFSDIIENGDNGLYLCQMPTGSGKTYNVVEAIKDYVLSDKTEEFGSQLDRQTKDNKCGKKKGRKIIYLTTLNKNVISNELKEAFGDEELYARNVLHIRANFDEVMEKLPSLQIPSKFRSQQYETLRTSIENYNRALRQRDEGRQTDGEYLEMLRDKVMKAENDFRISIGKELNRKFKSAGDDKNAAPLKEKKLDAIRHSKDYRWIGKLYPAVFTDDHQVLCMSVSKFMLRNSTIVEPSYHFLEADYIKDAVIFIDEFDATKETILRTLIESALKLNEEYLSLFRLVATGLSFDRMSFQMRQACMKAGTLEHDALEQKARDIMDRYHADLCFKTDKDTVSRKMNFLFKDSAYHTFSNDRREYIRTVFNRDENRSVIYMETKEEYYRNLKEYEERKKAYDEYVESGTTSNDPPEEPHAMIFMYAMLREIDVFLMRFNIYLSKWAEQYADIVNSSRNRQQPRMTADNAKSTILRHMSVSDAGQEIITGHIPVSRKKRVSTKDILPDISFYSEGFRLLDLVDDDSHNESTDLRIFKLGETPEKILAYLAQSAAVIGISATAEIPTVIGNYDLDYLKDLLGKAFHLTPGWLKEKMITELDCKWEAYRDGFIRVSASIIPMKLPGGSILNRCRDIFKHPREAMNCGQLIAGILESAGEATNEYYAARYCDIAQSMRWFCGSDARSMLSLSMAYPRSSYWKMEKGILEKILAECCRDSGLGKNAVKLFVLHDQYEASKEELLERLSKGEKIYVMSSYNTIGAGQNLQYRVSSMEGLVDLHPEGCGSDHRNHEKDFDALFLGDITNSIVNLNGEKMGKGDLMIKIAQIEELLEHGEISRSDATDLFRKVINRFSGEGDLRDMRDISYATESVRMISTQVVIQAVGRLCRTHIKGRNIQIFLEGRLAGKLSRSEFNRHILSPELKAVRDLLADTKEENLDRERQILLNRAENISHAGVQFIRSILSRGWKENEIGLWNQLRDISLRYPTASAVDRDQNELIRKLYITSGIKQNRYMYIQTGDYSMITIGFDMNRASLEKKKKKDHGGEGYIMTMSEADTRLEAVLKYPDMRKHFEEKGYACSFSENDYMMSPVIFNNIYKGALGEAAGRLILENELGIDLSPITDPDRFEFFDYELAPGIYIDFKNWKFTYQARRDEIYREIEEKLKEIGGKRAYVINLVSDGGASPISSVGGHIIEIPGLIDMNGRVITSALGMLSGEGI